MGDDNRGMADDDHFASSRMRQSHMFRHHLPLTTIDLPHDGVQGPQAASHETRDPSPSHWDKHDRTQRGKMVRKERRLSGKDVMVLMGLKTFQRGTIEQLPCRWSQTVIV